MYNNEIQRTYQVFVNIQTIQYTLDQDTIVIDAKKKWNIINLKTEATWVEIVEKNEKNAKDKKSTILIKFI